MCKIMLLGQKNGGVHVLPLSKPKTLALQCFLDLCSGRKNAWAELSLQRIKYYRTVILYFSRSFRYNNRFNQIYLRQCARKIVTIVLLEQSREGRFFRAGDPGSVSNIQKKCGYRRTRVILRKIVRTSPLLLQWINLSYHEPYPLWCPTMISSYP